MNTSLVLGAAAVLIAIALSGCTAAAFPRAEIERTSHDPPIWVKPDDIDRYVCTDSVFVCEGAVGRTSDRLCRCVGR